MTKTESPRTETCLACYGEGRLTGACRDYTRECPDCHGVGWVTPESAKRQAKSWYEGV